jgi:hypothetical protein
VKSEKPNIQFFSVITRIYVGVEVAKSVIPTKLFSNRLFLSRPFVGVVRRPTGTAPVQTVAVPNATGRGPGALTGLTQSGIGLFLSQQTHHFPR